MAATASRRPFGLEFLVEFINQYAPETQPHSGAEDWPDPDLHRLAAPSPKAVELLGALPTHDLDHQLPLFAYRLHVVVALAHLAPERSTNVVNRLAASRPQSPSRSE